MLCIRCQRDVPEGSSYCSLCGAAQRGTADAPQLSSRRLTRSRTNRNIAGVCGGIAEYFDIDVVLVRVLWVVLSIVPGAVFGGVLAYLAAWLLMPEATAASPVYASRLARSATDRRIAGVCGGLAEFFGVDATAVRLLWVVLSIVPGCLLGGLLAYLLAWLVMPPPVEHSGPMAAASSNA